MSAVFHLALSRLVTVKSDFPNQGPNCEKRPRTESLILRDPRGGLVDWPGIKDAVGSCCSNQKGPTKKKRDPRRRLFLYGAPKQGAA